MHIIPDKSTIKNLKNRDSAGLESVLSNLFNDLTSPEIHLTWPSFLEYIEGGPIFDNFPAFSQKNALYRLITQLLPLEKEKDYLIEVYDHVFAECLTHVKALPQIQPDFLIESIQKKRKQIHDNPFQNQFFLPLLDTIHHRLVQNPYELMHNLVLYLAWDRVCMNFAMIFEYTESDPSKIQKGLELINTCLTESFQHISDQKKTIPSFYRLIEALFAFNMRDENLKIHSEEDWQILCQSFNSLHAREELMDLPYIDLAMQGNAETSLEPLLFLTTDSKEKVNSSYALTNCIIKKLKQEIPFWKYDLAKKDLAIIDLESHTYSLSKR
ncbi:MAG: hypothetical protein BGO14_04760 [Chlamydiales bacterium 38-26]|nr:hypothetical protein [Chlamydiales bacterium]OJV07801.1 MAG: hypothetical protein BGO14_04760 [Chlamydiales bacterium 38-26]